MNNTVGDGASSEKRESDGKEYKEKGEDNGICSEKIWEVILIKSSVRIEDFGVESGGLRDDVLDGGVDRKKERKREDKENRESQEMAGVGVYYTLCFW